jgi:hypothetical protein
VEKLAKLLYHGPAFLRFPLAMLGWYVVAVQIPHTCEHGCKVQNYLLRRTDDPWAHGGIWKRHWATFPGGPEAMRSEGV